jgi:hypothetical protein
VIWSYRAHGATSVRTLPPELALESAAGRLADDKAGRRGLKLVCAFENRG